MNKKTTGCAVFLALLLGLCLAAGPYAWRYEALDDDAEIVLTPDHADVVYCTMEGVPQRLDLYLPQERGAAPWPVAIYVHGGSFTGGDKRKGSGIVDIPAMTRRGYAVAAVNYRLAPTYRFPAPVEDVKCAVRFLRAHAAEYGLDTNRLGIWGGSAGGYMAAFAGLADASAGFDVGEYLEQSSAVRAVADLFGPTDLTADTGLLQKLLLYRAFGTISPQDPILAHASPVNYVSSRAPPFLILHGEQDDAVPAAHSQVLYERLRAAGVTATLVLVKNANHNFAPTGGPISPSRAELSQTLGGLVRSLGGLAALASSPVQSRH